MDEDVLVLWDIDGTLLNAGGVGRELYDEVFAQLFGRSLEACAPMAGRTDRAIILETLTLAGVDEPRRHVDPFIAVLGAHAPAVRTAVTERGKVLPGAAEVLAALSATGTTVRVSVPTQAVKASAAPSAPSAAAAGAGTTGTVMAVPGGTGTGPAVTAPPAGAAAAGLPVAGVPAPGAAAATTPAPSAVAPGAVIPGAPAPGAIAPKPASTGAFAIEPTATGAAASGMAAPAAGTAGADRGPQVHQSVLTGNIRLLAEVKLTALGLRTGLDLCIGAYGDDHEDRTELVQVARRRAAAVHGRSPAAFAGPSTVVIGDTPLDVTAALAAGARAVAVATGSHSAADLREAGAHAVLPDLTDTAAVLAALFG